MKSYREDPDGPENEELSRQNAREVYSLQKFTEKQNRKVGRPKGKKSHK